MATTKKTTKTTAAKKTNDSKAKKTNNTKKKVEETNVVDEFLNTVVGETFTEEDVVKPEEKSVEVVKDESETVCQIVVNSPTTVVMQDDIKTSDDARYTNDELNDEPNEAEKQFDELFEEKKEPEQPVNTNPQIVYVNSAMGASWD